MVQENEVKSSLGIKLLRIASLIFVIGITIYVYSIHKQARVLTNYGYGGIFLLSILANATVILPAPGLMLTFTMGGVFNPLGVAIAAGSGAAIGELSAYLAGFSGQGVIENVSVYQTLFEWMKRHRHLIGCLIFILAVLPLPIFDLAGFASGALKIPVGIFFFWCLLGKLVKMLLIAYAGAYSLHWISPN